MQRPELTPERGLMVSATSIAANVGLALVKIVAGFVGHSYALVADGIESSADVLSSIIVWGGLRYSIRPADERHPYGHGKAESMTGLVVALALLAAAGLIAYQSVREILTPHRVPAWWTLPVLVGVVACKWALSRYVLHAAHGLESTALRGESWHHVSDAITSAAAAIGITVALVGGPRYAPADDWAALLACGVIAFNGMRLVHVTFHELIDAAAPEELMRSVREMACAVPGVCAVEKLRIRKYGLGYVVDIHVEVDGAISVSQGHQIGHDVKDRLMGSPLKVADVLVHVEPHEPPEDQPRWG